MRSIVGKDEYQLVSDEHQYLFSLARPFKTVVSRNLTEFVEISCVNLIDGTTLLR